MKAKNASEQQVKDMASNFISELTQNEIAYALDENRGEYRGFAALHDLMDANVILDGALDDFDVEYEEDEEDEDDPRIDLMNKVMDEINGIMLA